MALVALPIFREATEKENSLVNSHKPFKMVMWINDRSVIKKSSVTDTHLNSSFCRFDSEDGRETFLSLPIHSKVFLNKSNI